MDPSVGGGVPDSVIGRIKLHRTNGVSFTNSAPGYWVEAHRGQGQGVLNSNLAGNDGVFLQLANGSVLRLPALFEINPGNGGTNGDIVVRGGMKGEGAVIATGNIFVLGQAVNPTPGSLFVTAGKGIYLLLDKPGNTVLISSAAPGASEVQVAPAGEITVGMNVQIGNPESANAEPNTVIGFGSLKLAAPLLYGHEAGEPVIGTPTATVTNTPTATVTGTPPTSTPTATSSLAATLTPTIEAPPASGVPKIPTLSTWGILVLVFLSGGAGWLFLGVRR
jgi:hypothetical protein